MKPNYNVSKVKIVIITKYDKYKIQNEAQQY